MRGTSAFDKFVTLMVSQSLKGKFNYTQAAQRRQQLIKTILGGKFCSPSQKSFPKKEPREAEMREMLQCRCCILIDVSPVSCDKRRVYFKHRQHEFPA